MFKCDTNDVNFCLMDRQVHERVFSVNKEIADCSTAERTLISRRIIVDRIRNNEWCENH